MSNVSEIFGTLVFNDHVMKERLPSETYKNLAKTIKEGKPLDIEVANVVAHARRNGRSKTVPRIIRTGSSRFRASPPKSTTAS